MVLILILLLACTGTVRANTFQAQDGQPLDALKARALNQARDALDAARSSGAGSNVFDCLLSIQTELSGLGDMLDVNSTLTFISSQMAAPPDEMIVNTFLQEDLRHGVNLLAISRRAINQSAGSCGNSVLVVNRAQGALLLIDQIENSLRRLQQRFR
jgi:hypothetical protein